MSASAAPFITEIKVRFADCDPAGIVFYPRYFDMFNGVVEDWCDEGLGISFRELIVARGHGLPTVHIETDFIAPSTLGDRLRAELSVVKLGETSITVAIELRDGDGDGDGAVRVRNRQVLVLMDRSTGRALALPPPMRERVAAFLTGGGQRGDQPDDQQEF